MRENMRRFKIQFSSTLFDEQSKNRIWSLKLNPEGKYNLKWNDSREKPEMLQFYKLFQTSESFVGIFE